MDNLKLYEVNENYIMYLSPSAPHLFHNKTDDEHFSRKFIGVLISVNNMNYFAPLSSFKEKHNHMPDTLDFIKIYKRAVINLNCMFPVPDSQLVYVDIKKVEDAKYRALLQIEYGFIKSHQDRIRKNAAELYKQQKINPESKLAKRCNNFPELEKLCESYK